MQYEEETSNSRSDLWAVAVILLVIVALLSGCSTSSEACGPEQLRLASAGLPSGAQLFGPTALPMGQEADGYFAQQTTVQSQPLGLFEYRYTYLQRRVWDVEDNRRPGLSYSRTRTWAVQTEASLR